MDAPPPGSRLPGAEPQPLWAGVMIGMGVLCLLLLTVLVTVCLIGRKRNQRHRKMMRGKETMLFFSLKLFKKNECLIKSFPAQSTAFNSYLAKKKEQH